MLSSRRRRILQICFSSIKSLSLSTLRLRSTVLVQWRKLIRLLSAYQRQWRRRRRTCLKRGHCDFARKRPVAATTQRNATQSNRCVETRGERLNSAPAALSGSPSADPRPNTGDLSSWPARAELTGRIGQPLGDALVRPQARTACDRICILTPIESEPASAKEDKKNKKKKKEEEKEEEEVEVMLRETPN